jgi:hypothetical protein
MPRKLKRGDTNLAWVVTLTFAGNLLYWTSTGEAAEVLSIPGRYCGRVSLDRITEQLDLRGQASIQTVSLEVFFPEAVAVAPRIARGFRLAGSTVEISLIPVHRTSDWKADRYVAMAGFVADPQYGGPTEPVAFEVKRYEHQDDALWPPETYRVTELTWPTSTRRPYVPPGVPVPDLSVTYAPAEDAVDEYYPVPIGRPGTVEVGSSIASSTYVPCVPALPVSMVEVDDSETLGTLLLAGGHTKAKSLVLLYKKDGGFSRTTITPQNSRDALGQPVVIWDATGALSEIRDAGSWFTAWPNGSTAVGPGESIGEIARWMLRRSSAPKSLVGSYGAMARLQRFRFDGYLGEPVRPMDWLHDRIIGDFPAALLQDATGGYYLAPIRWRANVQDARAVLVEGDGTVTRERPVSRRGDGRKRLVAVKYARDTSTRKYTRNALRVVSDTRSTDATTVEYPEVYNEATAINLSKWLTWRDGAPHLRITLEVQTNRWGWLSPGDIVAYTEPDLVYDRVPCLVLRVDRTDLATTTIEITPTAHK